MNTPEAPKMAAVVVDDKDSGYPEFSPPQGFEIPEGVKPGDEFQSVVTLRQKDDGTLCLVDLDGAKFEAGPDKEEGEGVVEEEPTAGSGPEDGGYAAFQNEIAQKQKEMKGR